MHGEQAAREQRQQARAGQTVQEQSQQGAGQRVAQDVTQVKTPGAVAVQGVVDCQAQSQDGQKSLTGRRSRGGVGTEIITERACTDQKADGEKHQKDPGGLTDGAGGRSYHGDVRCWTEARAVRKPTRRITRSRRKAGPDCPRRPPPRDRALCAGPGRRCELRESDRSFRSPCPRCRPG